NTTANLSEMIRRATRQVEAIPGVVSAASSTVLPAEGDVDLGFRIDGKSGKKIDGDEYWRASSPHFHEDVRIPLLRGRVFNDRDTAASSPVIIISEAFAKKYWPGENAIGKRITIGGGDPAFTEGPREVIGIVGSVREGGLRKDAKPVMYVPVAQVKDSLTQLANSVIPLRWVVR